MSLKFAYVDEHLAVAVKPAGLLSVPGKGPEKADCVVARAGETLGGEVFAVHRLDMATSGLMLLARSKETLAKLGIQFEKRRIKKAYLAWVAGEVGEQAGEISLKLMTDWPNRPKQMVSEEGKTALTRWVKLGHGKIGEMSATKMLLRPITGRSHQLRVHLSAIGYPILGDQLYAPEWVRDVVPRLYLHAQTLGFWHPHKKVWIEPLNRPDWGSAPLRTA